MNDFKKKMGKKIEQFSSKDYLDSYIRNEFLTDDGDADIYLKISSKDDLIDNRTVKNQIDLRSEIFEFVENKTALLDNDIKINLHIIGVKLSENEQIIIKNIFREHYAIELFKIQKDYKNQKEKVLSLFLIGCISLLSYLLLYLFTDFDFFLEVFGFIFSFALWEAFDQLIYEISDTKFEREAISQNLLIEIIFD